MSKKSDFQDAAGAKVHFLEHPFEQTFRLFSSSGSGEAQKADSGSDRNDK